MRPATPHTAKPARDAPPHTLAVPLSYRALNRGGGSNPQDGGGSASTAYGGAATETVAAAAAPRTHPLPLPPSSSSGSNSSSSDAAAAVAEGDAAEHATRALAALQLLSASRACWCGGAREDEGARLREADSRAAAADAAAARSAAAEAASREAAAELRGTWRQQCVTTGHVVCSCCHGYCIQTPPPPPIVQLPVPRRGYGRWRRRRWQRRAARAMRKSRRRMRLRH